MLDIAIVAISLAVAGTLALLPAIARSTYWRAMATPLASIMGSGFFVCAPLLAEIAGSAAVICMMGLLVLSYGVGAAVRFNIRHFEPIEGMRNGALHGLEFLSRLALAAAYFISVSYYLQLLASFLIHSFGLHFGIGVREVAVAFVVAIGLAGMWRGLKALEALEIYAVSLKLGIVAALILALMLFNAREFAAGTWSLPPVAGHFDLEHMRILLGLMIVVQGFETSRYLGDEHSASERISSMRMAQLVTAAIYVLFVALITPLLRPGLGADVTAVVGMVQPVAMVLPGLLIVAALASQFSAAVADNAGAGGLLEEVSRRRVPLRYAYLLVMLVTAVITWEVDVLSIIALASRAFALYYMLQCLVAFLMAGRIASVRGDLVLQRAGFAALALICLAVFLFGLPAG